MPDPATPVAVTWDYRCPFARNAHEHLLTALEAGGGWDVQFLAFSLDQAHVDGEPAVWDDPDRYPGLLANQAGIVIRDRFREEFFTVHRALFAARHDRALDLRRRDVLSEVLAAAGVDAAAVLSEIDNGWPLKTFQDEHTKAVSEWGVFGVPTFVHEGRAAFVRLLDRPGEDPAASIRTIERIVELLDEWPALNEFKHTRIPR